MIMKENAMFALDLSGNYNKLLPLVATMPKLKTFGCLPAFGMDGDVIPSEINSFTVETRRRIRIKSDTDDMLVDDSNLPKSLPRSMSMIGDAWKLDDEGSGPPSVSNKRYSAMCNLEGKRATSAELVTSLIVSISFQYLCILGSGFSTMCQPSSKLQNVLKDMKTNIADGTKAERPIITFLKECHNLECLRTTMKCVMKKAICKNYGLRVYT